MKSTIYKAAMIATAIFCTENIHAQDQQSTEPVDTLQNGLALSIEITNLNDQNLGGATIKIYQDNKFIAELNNRLQPEIKVSLEKNSYYVMQVEKEGYVSKSLLVSTVLPAGSDKKGYDNTKYEHELSISLDKRTSPKNGSLAPIIGILYYDANHDIYIGSPMQNDAPNKADIIAQLENWLGS